MNSWIYPTLCQRCRLVVGVMEWGIFSWRTLSLLIPNEHHLNVTAYHGYTQKDNEARHKAHIISSWFHKRDGNFSSLQWPAVQSLQSNRAPLG
uniref:Uncharacterized protein n=1 Tax=Anguilla anguilla TaxID=7936 RepID=A0A0E9XG00_ANGAN